jgi:MFS family permease
VTLLFSSYLGVQAVAMLVTGAASARFGAKRTVLVGLTLVVAATAFCAATGSIVQLVGLRAVWGLGNALVIATALSVIVGAAGRVARSCCTKPRSGSASPSVRYWARCSATFRGVARSSARRC